MEDLLQNFSVPFAIDVLAGPLLVTLPLWLFAVVVAAWINSRSRSSSEDGGDKVPS
jgi:hypothetical protein